VFLALLFALTPPAPPSPQATRDVLVCRIELALPRGGIAVGKVCAINVTGVKCDSEEVVTVSTTTAFAEETQGSAGSVLLPPTDYWVREERYAGETRYLLVSGSRTDKRDPYLSLPVSTPMEFETRACPRGPLSLDKGQGVILFASGTGAAKLGQSLMSFGEANGAGSWVVAFFSRVK
jgi:hypothetical protein